jgi:hypothetical protein
VPGSVYAGHRFLDVLVHGWDLAVATGQDYALDPELMQACQQIIEPQLDAFRSAGALASRWRSRPMPARRPGSLPCSAEPAERPWHARSPRRTGKSAAGTRPLRPISQQYEIGVRLGAELPRPGGLLWLR